MWILLCAALLLQGSDRLWFDHTGHLRADARDALRLLAEAPQDGLNPDDYSYAALQAAAARIERGEDLPGERVAFDVLLEKSLIRYVRDLHAGRVDPRSVGFDIPAHPQEDFAGRVRAAVAAHRVGALAQELTPTLAPYRALRATLARYRTLARDPSLVVPTLPAVTVRPGDTSPGLPALRRWLAALGDLPDLRGGTESDTYDEPLVIAVRRFQSRHGLAADGEIGRATRAALTVPLAWRVRQIELSMERLRWLPDREGQRLVGVNVAMFRLWAIDDHGPTFASDVIVGRAARTRTPLFLDQIEQVIFRPSWHVPASIVRQEILPAIRRDPDYLQKHDMEFVPGPGALGVRQRPGPSNALGLVKFAFPNDHDVYLHGTPARALFARARRDFSHGCIRVADPVGLAEWILVPEGWSRERIVAAMDGPQTAAVTLSQPVAIAIFYLTAMVTPEDGVIHFADDIYRHDASLHQALERLCGSKTS